MTFMTAVAKHLTTLRDDLFYEAGANTNIFEGHMPSSPDVAVAVMPTGGRNQPTRAAMDLPSVQLIVRGDDVCDTLAMAEDLLGKFNCLDRVVLNLGGDDEVYVHGITAAQSAPIPMGQDTSRRYEFSVNLDAAIHAPSVNRPAA